MLMENEKMKAKRAIFKNCAPFTGCIGEINT